MRERFTMVNVEDLKKGDEVLIASGGDLRRIKLLNDPRIAKHGYSGTYSSIKCEILNANKLDDYTVTRKIYQNLNYRKLFLLKLGENQLI